MHCACHKYSQYQRIQHLLVNVVVLLDVNIPDDSRICSRDEREIVDVARGNERQ